MSVRYRKAGHTITIKSGTNETKGVASDYKNKYSLCQFHELPDWQKDNEYILKGYVKETNSFKHIFQSLFFLHNESVNIYTHLIPGIFCFIVIASSLEYALVKKFSTTTFTDYFVIGHFFLGALLCFTLSATFHGLKAHSEKISIIGNKLDYLGIVALIISSMISIMFYGFYDDFKAFLFFGSITTILGSFCTLISLKDRFRTSAWRGKRALMFILFGLSAVLPLFYGLWKHGYRETCKRIGLHWVLLEGVFYIGGASLYGMRYPEKTCPGNYDFFFNSHQIFHVLVVAGAVSHYIGLIKSYEFAHKNFY
ncbi:hypothetical protein QEN19_000289 [Hanseniaspora menglaensis]